MAVQLHYCCGKVASVSVGYSQSTEAGCKHGMKKTMPGCCNDQQVSIDVDDDQGLANGVVVPAQTDVTLPEFTIVVANPIYSYTASATANIRGSPPTSSVPLYLFNQVFRN